MIPGAEATIVVTGAAGFLGGRVVSRLATRAGQIRAGVRNAARAGGSSPSRPGLPRTSLVTIDVRDPSSLAVAFRGADAVIHCAAGDAESTVAGTRNVLAAAKEQGVRRVIHVSSAVVYGAATGPVDESTPMQSVNWSYADWKIASEESCRAAVEGGQDVVILRPSIIYGAGARTWGLELGDRLRSGLWGAMGPLGEGTCNLVFVDDLVDAIWLCVVSAAAAGRCYNVNGTSLPTWNEFFRTYNHALGYAPLAERRRETVWASAVAGTGLRGLAQVVRKLSDKVPLPASRRLGRELGHAAQLFPRWQDVKELYSRKVTYLDAKLRQELGYSASVTVPQGLTEMARWYRASLLEDDAARTA